MEYLIEALLDLILEGSIEISSNKKISKWIRYPLIVLIVLFFSAVTIGLFLLGIIILDESIAAGVFMIIISVIMIVFGVIKFKKIYIQRKEE